MRVASNGYCEEQVQASTYFLAQLQNVSMPDKVPDCRAALVQLAESGQAQRHLSKLPASVLQTVDVAVTVEDEVLAAHSFVLMTNSHVLEELLNSQSHLFNTEKVLQVPLLDNSIMETTSALQCMYDLCIPGKMELVSDHQEAIALLIFSHKYDAAVVMQHASDSLQHIFHKEKYGTDDESMPEHTVVRMVDITNAVQEFSLSFGLLEDCIDWFVYNYKWCRLHMSALHKLNRNTLQQVIDETEMYQT